MSDAAALPAEVLLRRARGGDRVAVHELIERNIDWLRARVRQRLSAGMRRELDSGDLVQDVVVSLLNVGSSCQVNDEDHFRALLIRVVDTDLRDRLRWLHREKRDRRREQALPSESSSSSNQFADSVTRPSQHADRQDRIAWIRAAMLRLEADDQRVLRMRIWEQRAFSDIAQALCVAEDAARMRVNRALARLARAVATLKSLTARP